MLNINEVKTIIKNVKVIHIKLIEEIKATFLSEIFVNNKGIKISSNKIFLNRIKPEIVQIIFCAQVKYKPIKFANKLKPMARKYKKLNNIFIQNCVCNK
ncbi:Uncharacterised protein [Mycoplasmopsis arginini]|nr:Uncharacterised protein [Chlamydia abortus]SGA24227.1 Uncharacterised protein [Mycoplasmopsis arginini]SGA30177.1 Uncharacterised protein [Mycoplasmopsis arginini]SGA30998.1 Uncharacterised protein [Chlamydia abortus]